METVPDWKHIDNILKTKREEAYEYIRQIAQEGEDECLNQ